MNETTRMAVAAAPAAAKHARPTDEILRFHKSERLLHWSIALPFMICYATALVLVVIYNPAPHRAYRELFSWIHRISGLCLIVLPLLTLVTHRRDYRVHVENIKQGWIWAYDDLKWLLLYGLAAVSSRVILPDQGKFNAAEKLNFMMVMSTYPLFILTGVLIWLPGVSFVSWMTHFAMAAMATPLMLGHIFMATINPGTRIGLKGMVTGFVDRQWAKHHYARWYHENFADDVAVQRALETSIVEGEQAWIRCTSCRADHGLESWGKLLPAIFEDAELACPNCGVEMSDFALIAKPQELVAILDRLEQGIAEKPPLEVPSRIVAERADSAPLPPPQ